VRTGRCPKCGSSSIYTRRNGIGEESGARYIHGLSLITTVTPVDTYLCTDCGYFENYIVDKGKLSTAAEKWDKV